MKGTLRFVVAAMLLAFFSGTASAEHDKREYAHLKRSPQPVEGWNHLSRCFSYPESARRDRTGGTVLISVLVLPDGTVGKTRIEEGVRADLNMAAECCMSRVRWIPGENADGPVATWVEIPVTYALTENVLPHGAEGELPQAGVAVKARSEL